MNSAKIDSPWVLVNLSDVIYAVSCNSVLSLNQMPKITPMPTAPAEVRGVIEFRSHLIELVDTRVLLGMKSMDEDVKEFSEMMKQRYQDHKNWIDTLEKSVLENTEFTLTTDPHKCAFGKWYDSYNPQNMNIVFLSILSRFDHPHKVIHQIGIKTQELIKNGQKDEAIRAVNAVKDNELKQMLELFEEVQRAYFDSRKEIVVVLGDDENCIGLSVDQIVSIEHLFDLDEELIEESVTDTKYLSGIGKRKDGSVVFLLNDEYILNKYQRTLIKK